MNGIRNTAVGIAALVVMPILFSCASAKTLDKAKEAYLKTHILPLLHSETDAHVLRKESKKQMLKRAKRHEKKHNKQLRKEQKEYDRVIKEIEKSEPETHGRKKQHEPRKDLQEQLDRMNEWNISPHNEGLQEGNNKNIERSVR